MAKGRRKGAIKTYIHMYVDGWKLIGEASRGNYRRNNKDVAKLKEMILTRKSDAEILHEDFLKISGDARRAYIKAKIRFSSAPKKNTNAQSEQPNC